MSVWWFDFADAKHREQPGPMRPRTITAIFFQMGRRGGYTEVVYCLVWESYKNPTQYQPPRLSFVQSKYSSLQFDCGVETIGGRKFTGTHFVCRLLLHWDHLQNSVRPSISGPAPVDLRKNRPVKTNASPKHENQLMGQG